MHTILFVPTFANHDSLKQEGTKWWGLKGWRKSTQEAPACNSMSQLFTWAPTCTYTGIIIEKFSWNRLKGWLDCGLADTSLLLTGLS